MTDVFRLPVHFRHTRQGNQGKKKTSLCLVLADLCSYRASDLYMKGIQNAKERDFADWTQLFKSVDPRFANLEVISPQGSYLSIISVTWEA